MKNIKQISLAFLALVFILPSCAFEKRVYMSGYNVEWKSDIRKNKKHESYEKNSYAQATTENKNLIKTNTEQKSADDIYNESPVTTNNKNTASTVNTAFVTAISKVNPNKKNDPTITVSNKSPFKANLEKHKQQNKKAAKKTQAGRGGKSWIVALLLCLFLGFLGIHRFYLGYVGVGILELFTAGLFGILWLIDLIRIIVGDLQPKNGSY